MRFWMLSALLTLVGMTSPAGNKLTLEEITRGEFRQDYMQAVRPMADGETYSQISSDGKQVVNYSFRTGKQVSVLFDATTARGPKIESVDNYIMSPDGKRMLIQTQTTSIYRHSFTAVFYIYDIRNNKLEPMAISPASRLPATPRRLPSSP